jgi:Membrane bound beta barrel domain (DUF5777)
VVGSAMITQEPPVPLPVSAAMSYYCQIIIGSKISETFSLQFMPTFVHRNLVLALKDQNEMFAAGIGARLKLAKRISLNLDYYYRPNFSSASRTYNPFSIGFDIETGRHIFQLHFTNANGMNEKEILTETTDNWNERNFRFGFNLSRSFQIKRRK